MQKYYLDFSIIVPCWRGAIKYLPRLFESIPEKSGVEIIVVDNSKDPVGREEIDSLRKITLLHSAPERHAGGSRNDGMDAAKGKWLLFADADDYYTPDAFDVFYNYLDSQAEIVYTGMGGVYEDTGAPSDRGEKYTEMICSYCKGEISEMALRTMFSTPCCKMISHELVERERIKFDEIRASNDSYFSLVSGYYARKIEAINKITYVATVNKGSLTQRRDFDVIKSRLYSKLKCNQFLRRKGLRKYQKSVMSYLFEARNFSLRQQFEMWKMLIIYKQNPFIGWRHWLETICALHKK